MTLLTLAGWIVAHALWQCTLIGGVAALALGLVRNARPDIRDRIAMAALAAMTVGPIVTALLQPDLLPAVTRRSVTMAVDAAIPMPTYLEWRSAAMPVIGALWMAGVIVGLIRFGVAWQRARQLRTGLGGSTDATDMRLRAEVDTLSAAASLRTRVEVRRSALAQVPMVLGARAPLILLPHQTLTTLSPEELRSILAHELAHVRRRDYAANVMQLAADCVTFFHPAARWMSRRIRIEREYSCDDAAIAAVGDRATYAHALAALDDARTPCAVAVAAVSGTLVDRIARIAGRPRPTLDAVRGAMVMAAALVGAAALLASVLAIPQAVPPGTKVRSQRPPAGGTSIPPPDSTLLPKRPSR